MNTRLFQQVKQARQALMLAVGFGVLGTFVILVQMTFLSQAVNAVFLGHQALAKILPLLLALLIVIIVRAGTVWLREAVAQRSAIRVKAALREQLFTHILRLGPAFTRREQTGELVATLNEGIERLDPYISRYLPQIYLSVLVPVIIDSYVATLDLTSAFLLLITGPIIPLLMILVGSYAEKHMQQQWQTLSRMSAHFLDVVQGLTTLKLFGRSHVEVKRITRVSNAFRDTTMKVLRYAFLSGMVLEFMTAISIGLVAVALGLRLINGGISFTSAFLILLLAPEFYRPLRDLGTHRHAGMEGKAAGQRILTLLDTPLPISTAEPITQKLREPLSIALSAVTYTYPASERPAVCKIDLTLEAGSCTALVGRSGGGKSTLANLLLRFIEPQEGTIRVNGLPLRDLPVETWREYVALVPQRPYLFFGSVRENLRMARPDATDEQIQCAAEDAGAAEFIGELPAGYDTEIGERGLRLSAGQMQRLAIARAFLKDAPFLILDEPTSSLDPESERLIRVALERLVRQRTTLIIAHRYNTIALAQQIAVLEGGRLVDLGQPSALVQREGAYAGLVDAYREVEL